VVEKDIFKGVGITWILQLQLVLVLGLFVFFSSSLPKEKERGNKGRAIYRAVGSQVTYATHTAPAAYALRVTLFTTSTYTDTGDIYKKKEE